MSLVNKTRDKTEQIIKYLRSHPDFFQENPDILANINIPHLPEQEVSSLLEYQVQRLRHQVSETETKIEILEKQTSVNSLFIDDVLSFSLGLYDCSDLRELSTLLSNGMGQYYSADISSLVIFSEPSGGHDLNIYDIEPVSDKIRFMFTELFHRNKPLCDSLQEEHLNTLFDIDTDNIRSTVILPLQGKGWRGLIVLGSREPNCYEQGIELEMLAYLSRLVQLKVDHILA